jgi:hypothetical protein
MLIPNANLRNDSLQEGEDIPEALDAPTLQAYGGSKHNIQTLFLMI